MASKKRAKPGKRPTTSRRYPNPTIELLCERASVRDFKAKKIPARVLGHILEAGIHSATGGNLQPYSIVKVESPATKAKLAEMCTQAFIGRAPVDLLFCIDWRRNERWARLDAAPFTATQSFRHFWISMQDAVICAQSIETAAASFGIGSCYVGTVLDLVPKVRRLLRLPRGVFPVVLLCLGYPKTRPEPRAKLGSGTVVHDERYRDLPGAELRRAFDAKYAAFKLEPTPLFLERLERVCRNVGGAPLARKALARVKRTGRIAPAQHRFGLHYVADGMPLGNERFLELMEQAGFGWFRKYKAK
jgi:FMN reductase [NAD(P)H]